jgi:hypothetical protein
MRALPVLEAWQLYFLCSLGDIGDIVAAVHLNQQQHQQHQDATQSADRLGKPEAGSQKAGAVSDASKPWQGLGVDWESLSPHEMAVELGVSGRCTALVKVRLDAVLMPGCKEVSSRSSSDS